jgi:hypothetical protein
MQIEGRTPWSVTRDPPAHPALPATVSGAYRRLSRPRGPHATAAAQATGRTPAADAAAKTEQLALTTAAVLHALAPGTAVTVRAVAEHLSPPAAAAALNAAAAHGDPLGAQGAPVTFDAPMIIPMTDIVPDMVFAGAASFPANTAAALATNPDVIVAYLVGLNHEISRELRWRGVPTDPQGTAARWFWDVRGQGGSTPDLKTGIAQWTTNDDLASHLDDGAHQLVVAIRADLLRRYPRTAVYAVRAVSTGGGHDLAPESNPDGTVNTDNVRPPQFTATVPPDLRIFGFDLPAAEAAAEPGWFFVLQEQASETRFGAEPPPGAAPADAYWRAAQLGLAASDHSATVAAQVRLPPLRCALHARALMAPATTSGR